MKKWVFLAAIIISVISSPAMVYATEIPAENYPGPLQIPQPEPNAFGGFPYCLVKENGQVTGVGYIPSGSSFGASFLAKESANITYLLNARGDSATMPTCLFTDGKLDSAQIPYLPGEPVYGPTTDVTPTSKATYVQLPVIKKPGSAGSVLASASNAGQVMGQTVEQQVAIPVAYKVKPVTMNGADIAGPLAAAFSDTGHMLAAQSESYLSKMVLLAGSVTVAMAAFYIFRSYLLKRLAKV